MGASIKFNASQRSANGFVYPLIIEITGPSSYAAGGFSVAAAALGLTVVDQVGVLSCSGGLIAEYVKSTAKVILRYPTGGAATSPATITTAPVATVSGLGGTVTSGTVTATYPTSSATAMKSDAEHPSITAALDSTALTLTSGAAALTPGVGKEPPDTANASTIVVTLLVMGRV
jgi:hypothetical protein